MSIQLTKWSTWLAYGRCGVTIAPPGGMEAGAAGMQPCRRIAWWGSSSRCSAAQELNALLYCGCRIAERASDEMSDQVESGKDLSAFLPRSRDAALSEACQGAFANSSAKCFPEISTLSSLCSHAACGADGLLHPEATMGSAVSLSGADHRQRPGFLADVFPVRSDLLDGVAYHQSHRTTQ